MGIQAIKLNLGCPLSIHSSCTLTNLKIVHLYQSQTQTRVATLFVIHIFPSFILNWGIYLH